MNWRRKPRKFEIVLAGLFLAVCAGCGVKGDPLPPEKPAELGRGRPTYKRATEGIQIQKNQGRDPDPDNLEEDDDDDKR